MGLGCDQLRSIKHAQQVKDSPHLFFIINAQILFCWVTEMIKTHDLIDKNQNDLL